MFSTRRRLRSPMGATRTKRWRRALLALLIGTGLAATGAVNLACLRMVANDSRHVAEVNLSNSMALARMRTALTEIRRTLDGHGPEILNAGRNAQVGQFLMGRIRDYELADARYRAIPFVDGETAVYGAADAAWERYHALLVTLLVGARPVAPADLAAAGAAADAGMSALNDFHDRQANVWTRRLADATGLAMEISLALLAAEMLGALALGALVQRLLARRQRNRQEHTSRMLQDVFDAMPNLVFIRDRNRRVVAMNRAMQDATGISPSAHATEDFIRFFGGPRSVQVIQEDWDVLRNGRKRENNASVVFRDQQAHNLHLVKVPLRDDEGNITGLVAIATDMTQLMQAQRSQEQLQKQLERGRRLDLVGQLTSGVAHDFNNLLMAVSGNVEYLKHRFADAPDLVQGLEAIQRAAHRGEDLVRRLMRFARSDKAQARQVCLNDVVSESVAMLDRVLDRRIEIVQELMPDLEPVIVDRSALEDALLNLAVNARDAMPSGGRLTFRTDVIEPRLPGAAARKYCRIRVRDTGVGMPEAVRQRAMEPFFTTKAPGKGTGLGLSSVREHVESEGGFVAIESLEGSGTTIDLYFPLLAGSAGAAPSGPAGTIVQAQQ